MGTAVAPTYATIYYSYHEEINLIPNFKDNLIFYKTLIDDQLRLWCPNNNNISINDFETEVNNFGILKWESEPFKNSVDFLDLTITINNRGYLDFMIKKFYNRLCNCGHDPQSIKEHILQEVDKIQQKDLSILDKYYNKNLSHPKNKNKTNKKIFFHLEYHPSGVQQKHIRKIFNETCSLLTEETKTQLIIAFSRPKNLQEKISCTQLERPEGKRVSIILHNMKNKKL